MAEKEATTVEVEIARDWWDESGERHPVGTKVKVSVDVAMEGIESGALRRIKKDGK